MHSGTVKWFDESKGYGFIKPDDDAGDDIFVHRTAVEKAGLELDKGDRVSFDVEKGRNGRPCAVNLQQG